MQLLQTRTGGYGRATAPAVVPRCVGDGRGRGWEGVSVSVCFLPADSSSESGFIRFHNSMPEVSAKLIPLRVLKIMKQL